MWAAGNWYNPLPTYGPRLLKMTDAQLASFGKAARSLCRDPKCPEVFKRQLEEAKTEWRRRHPKAQ